MEYYLIILILPAFFGTSHSNCGVPPSLDFGVLNEQFIDKDSFLVGENATYKCQLGFIRDLKYSNVVTCLSNSIWSTPETFCTRLSCGNPGDTPNGRVSYDDTLFGSRANYTCDLGYNMISRRNYRECQADGTWSNEVPVCEVQTCPPPDAIPDGRIQPDKEEYEYQNAVSYECIDKSHALIGHKTLVCTAYGNWSFDPPQCREVKCETPNVENAEKLSGFVGPYTLNSAVSFQCLSGYTMVGSSSVKCNATSQWEPPLPVCSRMVTQRPVTTTEKETEAGGMVTQSPTTKDKETETGGSTVTPNTTTKKKDENNGGGNNVGAVVGNTLVIFTMSVMAFMMNNGC